MASLRAVFCLPDYGFDPSEAAVPFTFLKEKGVECTIATQTGKSPVCDRRMIEGWTGSLLGAKAAARVAYAQFAASDTFKTPLAWTSPEFFLLDYDAVILPGGHDKGVKQIIEDEVLRTKLRDFFPLTEGEEPSKVCGAICHGVLILAWTKDASGEHSVLYNRRTTTLPIHLERLAVYGTGLVLGDYYRTYAGTWTAKEVVQALKTPEQYSPGPFNFSMSYAPSAAHVVKDGGYISGRWPGDAHAFGVAIWETMIAKQGKPTDGVVSNE